MADREPTGGSSRPTGEMQSLRPPLATPHASHDLVLLAAATDRDADPSLRAAATDQAAACDECAALARELRSISLGLAELPASRAVPRDMRITAEQAARLRRGGFWRRLLRPFGAEGLPVLRPIAATLTTLGLAGILLTALPLGFGTGGAALYAVGGPVPASSSGALAPAVAPTSAAEQQGVDARGMTSSPGHAASAIPALGPYDKSVGGSAGGPSASQDNSLTGALPQLPPLAWVSVGLVAVGLALFALLLAARRIA